ncbi:hypothetical protein LEP1GSC019_3781 [Leptospira interrogans serovar Pyrogenes str. 2006006960]|nr:hypothetical protein LEP1GSC019_3781 [Leptospira interrogans serovar Pyrogenes str. 2006006960]
MKKLNFPFHYFSKTILFFFLLIHLESCAFLFYQPTNQKYWKPDTFGFQYKEEIFKTFDGE